MVTIAGKRHLNGCIVPLTQLVLSLNKIHKFVQIVVTREVILFLDTVGSCFVWLPAKGEKVLKSHNYKILIICFLLFEINDYFT